MLMNLANYAQFEREMISRADSRRAAAHEVTRRAVGPAPYGFAFGTECDSSGRRKLIPIPEEREVIRRIKESVRRRTLLRQDRAEVECRTDPARRNGTWRVNRICIIHIAKECTRCGRTDRTFRLVLIRKQRRRWRLSCEGGVQSESDRGAATKGEADPQRGGKWFPAQVAKLLESPADRKSAARRAFELREQGMTLKEIGVRLAMEGLSARRRGAWYPSLVVGLFASLARDGESASEPNQ